MVFPKKKTKGFQVSHGFPHGFPIFFPIFPQDFPTILRSPSPAISAVMAAPPLLGFRLLGMGPCEGQLLGRLGNSTGNVHQGKLIYDIYDI